LAVWLAHAALTRAAAAAGLHGKLLQIGALAPTIALGLGVYLLAAWLLRCPELQDVRQALAARRPRKT